MPLIKGKSQSAFDHNVRAEMESGKSPKQSLAIAYAMKRKAKQKYAGGEIEQDRGSIIDEIMKRRQMADGGEVEAYMPGEVTEGDEEFLTQPEDLDATQVSSDQSILKEALRRARLRMMGRGQ